MNKKKLTGQATSEQIMNKEELTGQATSEQIKEWKEKYGDVFKITAKNSVCYMKKPCRKDIGYASAAGKENPLRFNEVILKNCWLGGDDEIKTDDALFLSVSGKLTEIIEVYETELEKL